MKYAKPPCTPEQHIQLLRDRGLNVPNEDRAIRYLINVGYYRLTGYMYHLQHNDGSHTFNPGVSFNDIILHYKFDKALRFLVLEYLERIEVALRAMLTDRYSLTNGFYWFTRYELFDDKDIYDTVNEEIRSRFDDPQERFLKAFKWKYTSENLPPSNMALELLSLGKLSRLYKGLSNQTEKMSIASDFGLPSTILTSWLVYLTNVRNICAHHSRLWNRRVTADRPTIPSRRQYKFQGVLPRDFNTTMYGITAMTTRLLQRVNPDNSFVARLTHLLESHPSIDSRLMGFPTDWQEAPAWG